MNSFLYGFLDELEKNAGWLNKATAKMKRPMSQGGTKGALHKQLGIPQGKKIPTKMLARAAKAPGKLGRRARFAEALKKMNK